MSHGFLESLHPHHAAHFLQLCAGSCSCASQFFFQSALQWGTENPQWYVLSCTGVTLHTDPSNFKILFLKSEGCARWTQILLQNKKPEMVASTSYPNAGEARAARSGVYGHPWLLNKFETSLGCMIPSLKKRKSMLCFLVGGDTAQWVRVSGVPAQRPEFRSPALRKKLDMAPAPASLALWGLRQKEAHWGFQSACTLDPPITPTLLVTSGSECSFSLRHMPLGSR